MNTAVDVVRLDVRRLRQCRGGFGVPGGSASTGEEVERAPARAAAKRGPDLIEAVLVD